MLEPETMTLLLDFYIESQYFVTIITFFTLHCEHIVLIYDNYLVFKLIGLIGLTILGNFTF